MKRILIIALLALVFQASGQNYMTPEFLWKLGRLSDMQVSPDGESVLYGVTNYSVERNQGKRLLHLIPSDGSNSITIIEMKGKSYYNARWRPDGKMIGYLMATDDMGLQLFEMSLDGSEPVQVSRIPGGINGFEYSPDQKLILFIKDVKLDQTPNDIHSDLPKANAIIADDLMYRHWSSWHDYSYSHIFVASYSQDGLGRHVDIMEGEKFDTPMNPWGGMEQISWSPDGTRIAYVCKKKVGKDYTVSTNSEIFVYDVRSRQTSVITDNGFDGYDMDPVWSPDCTKLVFKSMEEDGFESDKDRIIMFDFVTKTMTDLSEGFDQSSSHFVFSADGKMLYFISGHHATYQIYMMNLKKKSIEVVTSGDHNYTSFTLVGDQIIGTKMSMKLPTEIFAIDKKGVETQLSNVNTDLLKTITLANFEKRWITTTDGKKMLVWVILPPDFDPDKEYPALLYCQGGPQSAVSQFFSYRWNFQMMAAHGYVIVAPNRRGLPTFGQEWNDQISGDYGGQNMLDYLTAIDSVSAEPWVDSERLGSIGASYGGFSVFWLAGNHEKRFKAFISHCGIYNFESMYGSTEEYWFVNKDYEGAYWENPKPHSYKFSPHRYIQNWDTPIMIITGSNDFRIPYTQSLEAFNSAQLRGVPSKLLLFPEESHFVLKPQNSILWQREFYKWLDSYLK